MEWNYLQFDLMSIYFIRGKLNYGSLESRSQSCLKVNKS